MLEAEDGSTWQQERVGNLHSAEPSAAGSLPGLLHLPPGWWRLHEELLQIQRRWGVRGAQDGSKEESAHSEDREQHTQVRQTDGGCTQVRQMVASGITPRMVLLVNALGL